MNIKWPVGINDIGILKAKQSYNKAQANYKNGKFFHSLLIPQKLFNIKTSPTASP